MLEYIHYDGMSDVRHRIPTTKVRFFLRKGANYIFFYGPEDLFERCVAKGILIRDCSNYPGLKKGYYRVAVKLHEQNKKLIEVLEEVLS